MCTAFDVAAYILDHTGEMSAMKLQKLVYYSQAWSLVWDGKPLFRHRIEAWANGPVIRALYAAHRGQFSIVRGGIEGDPDAINPEQAGTIDAILDYYGKHTSHWLSALTHRERPWKEARADLPAGERGRTEITHAAMAEYYGSLV